MEDLLEYLARSIVDDPDAVVVESFEEDDGTIVLELKVGEGDAGKVIGRGGRTIAALRTWQGIRGQGGEGSRRVSTRTRRRQTARAIVTQGEWGARTAWTQLLGVGAAWGSKWARVTVAGTTRVGRARSTEERRCATEAARIAMRATWAGVLLARRRWRGRGAGPDCGASRWRGHGQQSVGRPSCDVIELDDGTRAARIDAVKAGDAERGDRDRPGLGMGETGENRRIHDLPTGSVVRQAVSQRRG